MVDFCTLVRRAAAWTSSPSSTKSRFGADHFTFSARKDEKFAYKDSVYICGFASNFQMNSHFHFLSKTIGLAPDESPFMYFDCSNFL